MRKLKRAVAISAIILSSVAASCSDMVHAKEVSHEHMGGCCSIPR